MNSVLRFQGRPMARLVLIGLAIFCFVGSCAFGQDAGKSDGDIRELKLRDWQPRSMLKTKVTRVNKPAFPVIDVHNHLGGGAKTLTEERVKRYLQEMDDAGVRVVVNLDGGWDQRLTETLAALDAKHPDRFLTFALIDLRGFDEEGWSECETARLRRSFEAGAKGLKFHKTLGLSYRDKDGKLLGIDDARLDPIWKLCGEMNRPVMVHTADPAAFFTPLDRFNERWHELNDHPNWLFHGDKFPSREELLEQRNRAIGRHLGTTFIAHFGNNPEDLETVGKWLTRTRTSTSTLTPAFRNSVGSPTARGGSSLSIRTACCSARTRRRRPTLTGCITGSWKPTTNTSTRLSRTIARASG